MVVADPRVYVVYAPLTGPRPPTRNPGSATVSVDSIHQEVFRSTHASAIKRDVCVAGRLVLKPKNGGILLVSFDHRDQRWWETR